MVPTLKCSRCGKTFDDFFVKVTTNYEIIKLEESGLQTMYNNISDATSEFLCKECFDKYCDCLDSLNAEYEGKYLANMVEIVDDIQYGDN